MAGAVEFLLSLALGPQSTINLHNGAASALSSAGVDPNKIAGGFAKVGSTLAPVLAPQPVQNAVQAVGEAALPVADDVYKKLQPVRDPENDNWLKWLPWLKVAGGLVVAALAVELFQGAKAVGRDAKATANDVASIIPHY